MKAIQAARAGGPEVMVFTDIPIPEPKGGQLLVRVEAAGVNFIDTYRRAGVYQMPFPHVPGCEGAGLVEGAGVDASARVGQRVAWTDSVTGTYAEYALVDADQAFALPDDVSSQTAAAVALQGLTADYLTEDTFKVGPDHTVVLYAAAGGVGQLVTQMVLAAGARLIAVVGSAAKIEPVARLGVAPKDIVVMGTMKQPRLDLPARVAELTDGQGADVVYDSIGRETFNASLALTKRRGLVVLFGGSSGQVEPFDPQELNSHGSLYLTRPKLNDYVSAPGELDRRASRLLGLVRSGRLAVSIGAVRPLNQAVQTHRDLEARQTTGKTLLLP
ncbi:MAG: quinone oxidoreductase [Micrococcales bacterium]|nr:quinone oxidoreductase [Micrococcales bacterium]